MGQTARVAVGIGAASGDDDVTRVDQLSAASAAPRKAGQVPTQR